LRSSQKTEEDDVQKTIILAIAGLTILAGCKNQPKNTDDPHKYKAPYQLALDTPPAAPNPAGITIPAIKYTANPDLAESRATLVIRFDPAAAAAYKNGPIINQVIMAPVNVPGVKGTLPADYMDKASKGLATLLQAYCVNGKVSVTVAMANSSLSPQAPNEQVSAKLLSEWIPIELVFKNPHPKC
jgi:hypothetical protein